MTVADASRPRPPAPRLTPERVRTMQFSRTPIGRRGLAEEEVAQFLQRVAEDIAMRDADDAASRATIAHYKNTLAHWQSEHGDYRDEALAAAAAQRPTIEAVNILSRAQQEADSYVAQTQAYCRRIAVDARQHAEQIVSEAQARAEEAADRAVAEYEMRQAAAAAAAVVNASDHGTAADGAGATATATAVGAAPVTTAVRAEAVMGAADAQPHPYQLELEEIERRIVWARTFLASLANVETQLRTAREALSFEFERLDATAHPDAPPGD